MYEKLRMKFKLFNKNKKEICYYDFLKILFKKYNY